MYYEFTKHIDEVMVKIINNIYQFTYIIGLSKEVAIKNSCSHSLSSTTSSLYWRSI